MTSLNNIYKKEDQSLPRIEKTNPVSTSIYEEYSNNFLKKSQENLPRGVHS